MWMAAMVMSETSDDSLSLNYDLFCRNYFSPTVGPHEITTIAS
jgi:hypothetical protein